MPSSRYAWITNQPRKYLSEIVVDTTMNAETQVAYVITNLLFLTYRPIVFILDFQNVDLHTGGTCIQKPRQQTAQGQSIVKIENPCRISYFENTYLKKGIRRKKIVSEYYKRRSRDKISREVSNCRTKITWFKKYHIHYTTNELFFKCDSEVIIFSPVYLFVCVCLQWYYPDGYTKKDWWNADNTLQ